MSRVFVFGSLNMDLSIACDRMPQAGETIAGHDLLVNPGGKGANQAVAAARMGATTAMVGAVGTDAFGEQLAQALAAAGVGTQHLVRTTDAPTGTALIVRSDGDNRIILDAGANRALRADAVMAVLAQAAEPGDLLITQLECDVPTTFDVLARAHGAGLFTVFNPAPACAVPRELWPSIDLVCLNETECGIMCGIEPHTDDDARRAAEALCARGAGAVAITLGSHGSALYDGCTFTRIAPVPVQAIDSTAAGDTYLGALAAELARGAALTVAAQFASYAAALTVTRVGAQQAIPTRTEVDAVQGNG